MIWYQDFLYTHYFNKTIFLKGELLSTIFFSLYINDMPESFGSRVTEKSFNIGQARIISHGYRVGGFLRSPKELLLIPILTMRMVFEQPKYL